MPDPTPPPCSKSAEIHRLLDGEISDAAAYRSLKAHIAACPACQRELDETLEIVELEERAAPEAGQEGPPEPHPALAPRTAPQHPILHRHGPSRARILVVEDDDIVLRSVARILRREGHEVLTAVDVDSAIQHAEAGDISAAIVDYALRRETGLAVLSHLRNVQPGCIRILLTGLAESAVFVECVNRGEVAKVIKKPFEPKNLIGELDEAFQTAERRKRTVTREKNLELEAERAALDEALREGKLALALQPLIDCSDDGQRTFAYEALLRPRHTALCSPTALIATAEQHGRIGEVGTAVFGLAREVLHQLSRPTQLFVNLHPRQLGSPGQLEEDLRSLSGHADRVVIEITEQSALQNLERWEESIRLIGAAGCRIAVDDLGAGYSSLGILADLQPDFIKLDMTLVRNIDREPRKQRLVSLVQKFGEATDAAVIAEGVETKPEALALRDCGVRLMQGYYYARPSEMFVADRVGVARKVSSD